MNPVIYRDCVITRHYMFGYKNAPGYQWEHPNRMDCEYDDGWTCVWCGDGNSIEECKDAIDEYYLTHGEETEK